MGWMTIAYTMDSHHMKIRHSSEFENACSNWVSMISMIAVHGMWSGSMFSGNKSCFVAKTLGNEVPGIHRGYGTDQQTREDYDGSDSKVGVWCSNTKLSRSTSKYAGCFKCSYRRPIFGHTHETVSEAAKAFCCTYEILRIWRHMEVSQNKATQKSSIFHGIFSLINIYKPSIDRYPHLWTPPFIIMKITMNHH